MTETDREQMKRKLRNLTFDGARYFWDEIVEWLDSGIATAEKKLRHVKTFEEFKEWQIYIKVCERLKNLPENMVIQLRQLLAETTDGDKKAVDFSKQLAEPHGENTEVKDV